MVGQTPDRFTPSIFFNSFILRWSGIKPDKADADTAETVWKARIALMAKFRWKERSILTTFFEPDRITPDFGRVCDRWFDYLVVYYFHIFEVYPPGRTHYFAQVPEYFGRLCYHVLDMVYECEVSIDNNTKDLDFCFKRYVDAIHIDGCTSAS